MADLGPYVEQQIANMTEDEFDALAARVREPAELTPMEKAAAALRRSRGLDRKRPATKEQAAAAMRTYQANK